MRRSLTAAILLALAFHAPTIAQQVGESFNVMPVWTPCDPNDPNDPDCAGDPRWPDAWKYGDIYLQRQLEPDLAVAARNPEHILTGVIDYSGVEVANDLGAGTTLASRTWQWLKGAVARAFGADAPAAAESTPKSAANGTGEAWIRMIWSTNGGATSTPFFMPGAPWDTSDAAATAPYRGRATGAADPVVVAAPDNRFYVTFLAFKRGEINYLMVARFLDENLPNAGGLHSLKYEGMTTVTAGNNATFGKLNDKPDTIVVPSADSPVGYNIYVSYTIFNGNPGGGKFQSQIMVAKSVDGGQTFVQSKVSESTQENTGTVLVPTAGGQAVVLFRNFGSAPTIYVSRETASGWTKPDSMLGRAFPALAAYDQGVFKVDNTTQAALQASEQIVTPRANAFPVAALGPDNTIYAAWTECVGADGAPLACGPAGGSPRVMLMWSTDGGASWQPNRRKAVDIGLRREETQGLGYFFWVGRDDRNAHPQLMPQIACGGGQCLLTYWESRTKDLGALTGRISGYHRLMDLRGAILSPGGTVTSSLQLSRYPYRKGAKLVEKVVDPATGNAVMASRPEGVNDIARVNEICTGTTQDEACTCTGIPGSEPPIAGLEAGCIPRLNFYGRPTSGGGTTAFMGDYIATVPSAPFAYDAQGRARFASQATDVPWAGFLVASADNRNLLPPNAALPSQGGVAPQDQLSRYRDWQPGVGGLPSCEVGGSRNTDTLLTRVSLGLIVSAPVTAQATPSPGDEPTVPGEWSLVRFTVQAQNNGSVPRRVLFKIDTLPSATVNASFERTKPGLPPFLTDLTREVTINQFSTSAREVFVYYPPGATPTPVKVSVTEMDAVTLQPLQTNSITFNAGGAQPSAGATPSSVTVSDPLNYQPENYQPENYQPENYQPENYQPENYQPENYQPENFQPENSGLVETTWLVTANGDPTKTYLAAPSIDRSFAQDYDFRMVIYRLTSIGACVDASGKTQSYRASVVSNTGTINLATITYQPENFQPENYQVENVPAPDSPDAIALDNSLFTAKPSTPAAPAGASFRTAAATTPTSCGGADGYRIGTCVDAQPPEPEHFVVKLTAAPKRPVSAILAAGRKVYDPKTAPAALVVIGYACDPAENPLCRVERGPDLVVAAPPPAATLPVSAGASIQFPATAFTSANVGTLPAGPRRYGIYLSNNPTLERDQVTGLVTEDRRLTDFAYGELLPAIQPGAPLAHREAIAPFTVTVPTDLQPNVPYYLFVFGDDLRQVSELDEENNVALLGSVQVAGATADLAVSAAPLVSPASVTAGGTVTFPQGGYVVANQGTAAAGPRRYGLYLSADANLDATDSLVGQVARTTSLPAGGSEIVPAQSITIAGGTAPGTYRLFLVADDLGQVAESNEANNVAGPALLTVTAGPPPSSLPTYGVAFDCTPNPARGATCTRGGNGAFPLFWNFTIAGQPVVSKTLMPRLRFYRSNSAWQVCSPTAPNTCVVPDQATAATWPLALSLARPDDVATGSSDFRYKDPFTWQYNWQRLDASGKTLRGYFLLYLEVDSVGDTLANRKAIGPVRIYLP